MDPITLNYDSYDEQLKAALSGKEPGESVVLTVRAKVNSNSDESITLDIEEVELEDATEAEAEGDVEEEAPMGEEDMPAMVVAISKKKK